MLDYIFTDEERLVEKLDYDTPLGKSDHVYLTWSYIIKVTEDQQMPNIRMLNYWKGNYSPMNAELKQINWEDEFAGKATEESYGTVSSRSWKTLFRRMCQSRKLTRQQCARTRGLLNQLNVKYLEEKQSMEAISYSTNRN